MRFIFVFVFLICSCQTTENKQYSWQQFPSRDSGIPSERITLYRAKVPDHWTLTYPSATLSIQDSTLPNTELFIDSVHITFHTFPTSSLEQRIPPESQIQRWKRQFDDLDFASLSIEPRSLGGFTGLSMSATGSIKDKETAILGYSMEITPMYWRILSNDTFKNMQMASSYTIKAVGSPEAISKWQKEIELFANSFELIEEIPSK